MSKTTTIARMRRDGTVVEVLPDGSEREFPQTPMRPMTDEEIEAAAWADPDARPMMPEEMAKARRVPRIKTLRRALRLTQEEFAARYKIPLGTLRDWEQGRSEPDATARAYLTVIAHDPKGVKRGLSSGPIRSIDTGRHESMNEVEVHDWATAPKDGSVINVQFPDGKTVTKAKWNIQTLTWEAPRRGKWSNMRDVHGVHEPTVWWPESVCH